MWPVDEGRVHAWLDGALPPDEAAQVEALVRDDAAWAAAAGAARGLIANASRLVQALDDGAGATASGAGSAAASRPGPPRLTVVPGNGARSWRLARRVGAIAAVLLVAVVGRLAWTNQGGADVAPEATEGVSQRKASRPPPPSRPPMPPPPAALPSSPVPSLSKTPPPPPAAAAAIAEAVSAASNAVPPAAPPAQVAVFAPAAESTVSKDRATAVSVASTRADAGEPSSRSTPTEGRAPASAPAPRAEAARATLGARESRESREASALPLQQDNACVRFAIAWPADGAVPAATAETLADGRQLRFEGDTVRLLQVPTLVRRRDGTTDPATVRLAVSRRTGTGVAEAVRPDGAVVRRGQVTATTRCP